MPLTLVDLMPSKTRRARLTTIARSLKLGRLRFEVEASGGTPTMRANLLRPIVRQLAQELDDLVDFNQFAKLPNTQVDDIVLAIIEGIDRSVFEALLIRAYRRAVKKGVAGERRARIVL